MNNEQAAAYKAQLVAMRAGLVAQMAEQRGGAMSRVESAAEHFARAQDSDAQVATAREIEFAISEHEIAEIAAIDAALQRIEAGTYGECKDCGVDILPARLKATPEAVRCVPCQEQFEHARPA